MYLTTSTLSLHQYIRILRFGYLSLPICTKRIWELSFNERYIYIYLIIKAKGYECHLHRSKIHKMYDLIWFVTTTVRLLRHWTFPFGSHLCGPWLHLIQIKCGQMAGSEVCMYCWLSIHQQPFINIDLRVPPLNRRPKTDCRPSVRSLRMFLQ